MMMDPLVGAVCNPNEIWQMVDELLVAQEPWLPQYGAAIAEAKRRIAAGRLIQTREGYQGAARLPVKSVEEMKLHREEINKTIGESDKAKERPAASH